MNEFLPRTEPVASAASAKERLSAALRVVTPISPSSARADATTGSIKPWRDPPGRRVVSGQPGEDQARALSAYARIHASISDVVGDLAAQPGSKRPVVLKDAEDALLSLMPQPTVVLPLPPASQDMVAFVAQVTQSIARQAALARAAQSNVSAATLDAATA